MRQTRARKIFKDCFGQNNHYLITTLVGLDYIENNEVKCPETFSTSWNPRDKCNSVYRSRNFVLSTFLSSAVDGIDLYLNVLCEEPRIILDNNYFKEFSELRFVSAKFTLASEYFKTNNVINSLCRLLITIRNIHVHNGANNNISDEDIKCLLGNKENIEKEYCGCNIEQLISKIKTKESITFKEVATLIKATHKFVEEVDTKIISKIDNDNEHEYYCRSLLYLLKGNKVSKEKYLRMQSEDKIRFIKNLFMNNIGISVEDSNYIDMTKLNHFCAFDIENFT